MIKLAALTFITGLVMAYTLMMGVVFAQTNTPTTSPTNTPMPTEVVPTSAPATGRG